MVLNILFIFTSTLGSDPIWLIFFKWVETTNQSFIFLLNVQVLDREFLTIHPLQMDHFSTSTSHLHPFKNPQTCKGKIWGKFHHTQILVFFFRFSRDFRDIPQVFMMTRGTRGDVQPFVALARGLAQELGWLVPELHDPLVKSWPTVDEMMSWRGEVDKKNCQWSLNDHKNIP